ncbi:MAG: hypothetical protein LUD83_09135 [Clostridiales bacterium]|nr:hypothetical protein [Clostridiales bacterium]
MITDNDLLAMRKVKPEDASRYLQGEYSAQEIRVLAQYGRCCFCTAELGKGGRYRYHIHPVRLMQYRRGEIPMERRQAQ